MEQQKTQLQVNIDTIIEYLWKVPGVVKVEVVADIRSPEHTPSDEDNYEKRVQVTFAGCSEPVGIELY